MVPIEEIFKLAYEYFWKLLVPQSGRSEYPEGELLRCG